MSQTNTIKPAPLKLLTTHNSDDDTLVLYLKGQLKRTELSSKLTQKLERVHICADLTKKYGNSRKTCVMLQGLLKDRGEEISYSTAINIFNATQRIYASTAIHSKRFWLDVTLGEIQESIRVARAAKEFKAVATHERNLIEIVKQLGSGDAELYDKIQPVIPEIGFFPEELKTELPPDDVLQKELAALMNKQIEQIAEDVEYTDENP